METFTAAQARALMPDRIKDMVETIHKHIRTAAENGLIEVRVSFNTKCNVNGIPWKVLRFLEQEGYEVILTNGMDSVDYIVSWRESEKNFQKFYQSMLFALNNFPKIFRKILSGQNFLQKFPKKIEEMKDKYTFKM